MMVGSKSELEELVGAWFEGTLPAAAWTHGAHVATCTYLVWNHTLPKSYRLMKEGLYRFNAATGTPNTEERGYHETLTRFWVTILFFQVHRGHYSNELDAVMAALLLYAKNSRAERPYYSFDVLKSKDARRSWIAPDLPGGLALEAFHWAG